MGWTDIIDELFSPQYTDINSSGLDLNEDIWKDILEKKIKNLTGWKKEIKKPSFLHLLQFAKLNSSIHLTFEQESIYIV